MFDVGLLNTASPELPNVAFGDSSFNQIFPLSEKSQSLIAARREAERVAFIRWQEALAKWLNGWQSQEEALQRSEDRHHNRKHPRITEFGTAANATLNYVAAASSRVSTSLLLGFKAAADVAARRIAEVANIKPVVDDFVSYGSQATQRLANNTHSFMNPARSVLQGDQSQPFEAQPA